MVVIVSVAIFFKLCACVTCKAPILLDEELNADMLGSNAVVSDIFGLVKFFSIDNKSLELCAVATTFALEYCSACCCWHLCCCC